MRIYGTCALLSLCGWLTGVVRAPCWLWRELSDGSPAADGSDELMMEARERHPLAVIRLQQDYRPVMLNQTHAT
jgi:hypothetical protein